jgi:hypothetical protein
VESDSCRATKISKGFEKEQICMATATLSRTDEEIQQAVLAELKWDARIQPNEIGVSVKDGVVTLTGWVDSFLKKWDAEEAAHRVSGAMKNWGAWTSNGGCIEVWWQLRRIRNQRYPLASWPTSFQYLLRCHSCREPTMFY